MATNEQQIENQDANQPVAKQTENTENNSAENSTEAASENIESSAEQDTIVHPNYHSNALHAASLSHSAVNHVRPRHNSLDL